MRRKELAEAGRRASELAKELEEMKRVVRMKEEAGEKWLKEAQAAQALAAHAAEVCELNRRSEGPKAEREKYLIWTNVN